MISKIRVAPGTTPGIARRDASDDLGLGGKHEAEPRLSRLKERLEVLQQRLYSEGRHSVLLVLQGLDASGKDGVIRTVFEGLNPQGCRVADRKSVV